MANVAQEIREGGRFGFGKNWRRYLASINPRRIARAEESLRQMLGVDTLADRHFLDIGCGSGLFSLAARRLGARVHSFDFDPASVTCTRWLKHRYLAADPAWTIAQGSILDEHYLASLQLYHVVYAWGVLHHTGHLWQALDNTTRLVADGGTLFVAIYNDQGGASRRWTAIKRLYNRSAWPVRAALVVAVGALWEGRSAAIRAIRRENPLPFEHWKALERERGMAIWSDLVDWVGGYPFEVAKPEEVLDFCRARGFELIRLVTRAGGHACNEYVFHKVPRA